MQKFAITALIILLYGNPLLIGYLWLTQLTSEKLLSPPWRRVMSWLALSLATAAVGVFWIATLTNAFPKPEAIAPLRIGFYTSLTFASGAVVAALLATGKRRAWTVASALIVALNWVMWAAFQ